ncbi:MAG TPA: polysaccharide biosynthesis/export family protein [Candidatus Aquilonibacter sp.]|nr:polysaccharide biosynthesis/export family protein [Candidatus Aquilonibacter sp.]
MARLINNIRGAAFRRCVSTVALAVLGMALARPAGAQFSGPGPTISTPETATVTTDRSILYPPAQDPLLAPGDLITVHVFDQPDYTPSVRLGTNGNVLLPLVGTVNLNGLTVTQAERLLEQKLRDAGIYRNPQVTIDVTEGPNQAATVAGEVHAVVPIIGSRRLLDVLAVAGGLPATASHVITISRPGVPQPIVVDLGTDPLHSQLANIPIFPGDTIIVSRIGVVYMVGAFRTTGAIPLNQYSPLTLMEATALSGGLNFQGKFNDVRLIRTVGDHRTVVKLDIQRIMHGKDPDPILQPNDIVFLPDSTLKASISNGSLGTLLGIVSLLISVIRY